MRFFDHNTRDEVILSDGISGEHLAALDTVISRTHAYCHFERSDLSRRSPSSAKAEA